MKKLCIAALCVAVAFAFVSCKKEGAVDSKKMFNNAENTVQATPKDEAMKLAKDQQKKKGEKGLMEGAISRSSSEFCFALGVNIAELQVYYSLAEQDGAQDLFKDSMGFMVKMLQQRTMFDGDAEEFKGIITRLSQKGSLTVADLKAELNPFIGKLWAAAEQKYGDDGKLNLALGAYTYATLVSGLLKSVKADETRTAFNAMRQYLDMKGKSTGSTYSACIGILNQLNAPSMDYSAITNDAKTIIATYWN